MNLKKFHKFIILQEKKKIQDASLERTCHGEAIESEMSEYKWCFPLKGIFAKELVKPKSTTNSTLSSNY